MAFNYAKNVWANLRQLANKDVWEIADAGAPTSGSSGTGNGFSGPGSVYTNTTNGAKYINTGTKASPTWSLLATSAAAGYNVLAAGTAASGTTTGTSISVAGALTTDLAIVTWRTAAQTVAHILAVATTDAITVTYRAGTEAQTVGTAGVVNYYVIRAA